MSRSLMCSLGLLVLQSVNAATINYYRFEEGAPGAVASGANSVIDSTSGNHGTPGGSPTYRADVPVPVVPRTGEANNISMEFDGNSLVSFTNRFQFHISGDATVEFWIRFTSTAHESILWTRLDGEDTDRYNFFRNFTSPNSFNIDPRVATPGIFDPAVPISPDAWTHLAVVRVGDDAYSVYKDGLLFAQAVDNTPLPTAIGWTISGRPGFHYRGFIDELRISDAALAPSEFLNSPSPIPEPSGLLLGGAGLLLFGVLTHLNRTRSGVSMLPH